MGEAGKKPLRQHVDAVGEDSGPLLAGVVPSRQWRGSTPRRLFSTALSVLYVAGSSRRLFRNSSSVLFPLLRHGLGRALGLKPKMQPRNRITICYDWLCFALLGRVVRHFLFCSIELQHWQERRCSTGIAFAGSKRLRCGTRCCLCSNPPAICLYSGAPRNHCLKDGRLTLRPSYAYDRARPSRQGCWPTTGAMAPKAARARAARATATSPRSWSCSCSWSLRGARLL